MIIQQIPPNIDPRAIAIIFLVWGTIGKWEQWIHIVSITNKLDIKLITLESKEQFF